jgi:acid phosphatase type 7
MGKKAVRQRLTRKHHISIAALFVVASVVVVTGVRMIHQGSASSDPVIVAVGDIACDPADSNYNGGLGTATRCHMKATSDLAVAINPNYVLLLGDNQYETGTLAAYQTSYEPTWGRLKSRTKPILGNHEYFTTGAAGYFDYFGAAAGDRNKGYYSYNVGSWHVVALNSNCASIGGCHAGSVQEAWLRADLATNKQACTLAYWHHPRFSSGSDHGSDSITQPLWQALFDARADVVLSGHDHDYERFGPQRADGVADSNGVVAFVVGSGGKNLYPFGAIQANSISRNSTDFGVLKLTLHGTSYDWQFVAEGGVVKDSGTTACVVPAVASGGTSKTPSAAVSVTKKTASSQAVTPGAVSTATPEAAPPAASPSPSSTATVNESAKMAEPPKRNWFVRTVDSVKNFFVTAWSYWTKEIWSNSGEPGIVAVAAVS